MPWSKIDGATLGPDVSLSVERSMELRLAEGA